MTCRERDAYERGAVGREDFLRHARACGDCRPTADLDRRLDAGLAELRAPVEAPGLWDRIERSLAAESARRAAPPRPSLAAAAAALFRRRPLASLAAGASLVAAGALAVILASRPAGPSAAGILAESALARVERVEKDYAAAIRELERQAGPARSSLDIRLASLYRDKLETIDAQIVEVREVLDRNPANAHLRNLLLAALRDKRDTLAEMLGVRD